MVKQNPKNKYLIFATCSVIFMIVFSCCLSSVLAKPQTDETNVFHFPDAQGTNLSDNRKEENIHRIIFGSSDLNHLNSLPNINEVK